MGWDGDGAGPLQSMLLLAWFHGGAASWMGAVGSLLSAQRQQMGVRTFFIIKKERMKPTLN